MSFEDSIRSNRIMHTPSSFAKHSLIFLQETGTLRSVESHWSKREQIESYLLFMVKSGKGVVKTEDETEYQLSAGDLVWVDCRKAYGHCSSEEEPWELAWVHFDGGSVKAYYDFFLKENGSPVLCGGDFSKVAGILDEIMAAQGKKDVYGEFESAYLLTKLMTQVILSMKEHAKPGSDELFERIRVYVAENFMAQDIRERVMSEFGITKEELSSGFEKRYGISLRDYVLSRKFTTAKELLRFSVKSIEDVIEESGIGNADLFYRLFSENENMTPEKYREKWAGWIRS